MTVPSTIAFTSIPDGGVFTPEAVTYYLKIDANTAINLASAAIVPSTSLPSTVTYFPKASLSLG